VLFENLHIAAKAACSCLCVALQKCVCMLSCDLRCDTALPCLTVSSTHCCCMRCKCVCMCATAALGMHTALAAVEHMSLCVSVFLHLYIHMYIYVCIYLLKYIQVHVQTGLCYRTVHQPGELLLIGCHSSKAAAAAITVVLKLIVTDVQ
jgi:hypothetical protein